MGSAREQAAAPRQAAASMVSARGVNPLLTRATETKGDSMAPSRDSELAMPMPRERTQVGYTCRSHVPYDDGDREPDESRMGWGTCHLSAQAQYLNFKYTGSLTRAFKLRNTYKACNFL